MKVAPLMTWLAACSIFIGAARTTIAGEWTCNPSRQFHLDATREVPRIATREETAWIDSYVATRRERGDSVSHLDILTRSSARLTMNGQSTDCPVFQTVSAGFYYVSCEDAVVDFSNQRILSLGTGGISAHVAPSGEVAAIVHTTGNRISGVPVGPCLTPPHFLWNPWFRGTEVWWY